MNSAPRASYGFSEGTIGIRVTQLTGIVGVMCPNAELPLPASHEVRVVVGHSHVVDRLVFASFEPILDRHPLPIVARQQVADLQLARGYPTFPQHIERVLCRCPNNLATNVEVKNRALTDEDLFDALRLYRCIRIRFRTGQHPVANFELLDRPLSI